MPVTIASFNSPGDRNKSECSAADVEISCLELSKSQCGGDPVCVSLLEKLKDSPLGLKRDKGCTP
jgi:hypothetical protein